jgi:hypothetical protein
LLVLRLGEQRVGQVALDQLALVEERRVAGDPGRLLHVVSDDHDGVPLLELVNELFDADGGDRVEGRAGLVHQQHLGLEGERAGDAESLLLAAGQAGARAVEDVLDLFPQRGLPERLLDPAVRVVDLRLGEPQTGEDVVANRRHGKRIGLLEHHADPATQAHRVHGGRVDVGAVEQDATFHARARGHLVHTIEAPHERRFAAARRADDGSHAPLDDRQRDAADGLRLAEEGAHVLGRHLDGGVVVPADRRARGDLGAHGDGAH